MTRVERRSDLVIEDPYRWLEDTGDPRARSWMLAQQELFESERSQWTDLARWRSRLAEYITFSRTSLPQQRGGRTFFTRREMAGEQPVLFVEEHGSTRALVDPVEGDPTGRTVLEAWTPSRSGDLLACQMSTGGTEDSVLTVLDIRTGAIVDGPIDRVRRSPIAWSPDGRGFYYVRRLPPELNPGEERYHRRVHWHLVGSDPGTDVEIFGAGLDKTAFYDVDTTPDGRWLTITATTGTAPDTEIWLANLDDGPAHRPLLTRLDQEGPARTIARIVSGTGAADGLYLHTTHGAPNGRIMLTDPAAPGSSRWQELIPERDAVLSTFEILSGGELAQPLALIVWTRHAVAEVTVHDLADGRQIGAVELPGNGTVGALAVRPEGGADAWLSYTDHVTPLSVLHVDLRTHRATPWPDEQTTAIPADVHSRQVTYTSHDGTEVRMFVLAPTATPDRPRPTILTGYGGFGRSMSPQYAPDALAWVSAGGVYAVACLRGGGEEGEQWHRSGMGAGKLNVFADFAAAAEHLVSSGWTTAEQLGALGGSNGGLVAAVAITSHPERYAAAVCRSALLDMVRYERSGLGPSWRSEYGSADDTDQLRTLLSYSPYHRVPAGVRFPAVMLASFGGDTRVDPLHSRKMCAALQHAHPDGKPIVLRYEEGVGHGIRPLSSQVDMTVDTLAFFARYLGLTDETQHDKGRDSDDRDR